MRSTDALSRVARKAALVVVLAVVLICSSASAATEVAVPGTSVVSLAESYMELRAPLPRYATVLVAPSLVSMVKSASPSTLVLEYKEAMSLADDCGTAVDGCRTGITYQQAAAHDSANPNDPWILRDSAGRPISNTAYAHVFLANVGSVSYQQQWATNVAGAIKRLGYNGTSLDNVSANISGWPGWSGVYPTLYPSASAWEPAMKSFIAYIGPAAEGAGAVRPRQCGQARPQRRLRDQGLVDDARTLRQRPPGRVLRAGVGPGACSTTTRTTGTASGRAGSASSTSPKTPASTSTAAMKGSATDTAKMMYGKASFLLEWNGKRGGFFWQMNDTSSDPWNPAWTTYIGTPSAARYQVGVGWRRNYTGGTALVNPSPTTAQTFNLGASYNTPAAPASPPSPSNPPPP